MDIIKGMKCECIYISKSLSTLIMYKDEQLIDSKPISDFTVTFNGLCKKIKCEDNNIAKYISDNLDTVDEVVFTSEGINRFSLK